MRKESAIQLEGGHVVVIGGSSGIGLAVARLAWHEDAEVTIAGRSQDKLIQAQQELGKVHTVVMDITDEGTIEKVFAGLSRVNHVLISAGIMLNGAIVNHGGSDQRWCRLCPRHPRSILRADIVIFMHGGNGQA